MADRMEISLFDAGMFIGALLSGDPRHSEARELVEAARSGTISACTTPGILSEVYGALTWERAQPRHSPTEAAETVRLLIEPPSAIEVLEEYPLNNWGRLSSRARHFASAWHVGPGKLRGYLEEGLDTILRTLVLAAVHRLTARRVHDARHAAVALQAGIRSVHTYDADDWLIFAEAGLHIAGPSSTLARLLQSDPRL